MSRAVVPPSKTSKIIDAIYLYPLKNAIIQFVLLVKVSA